MKDEKPKVSIIILCHNDGDYLRQCLFSVCTFCRFPYEIILVDNASENDSRQLLLSLKAQKKRIDRVSWLWGTGAQPKELKRLEIISNRVNRYFAGGNNQGIVKARGEFILLLNADTWVGPHCLENLLLCAQRNPQAGLIGPYTNGGVGRQLLRGLPEMKMDEFLRFAKKWSKQHEGKDREVHRLTAFCLLIKRSVIERVGLLDERFGPGGYEDYDYCIRVRRAGYRIFLAQDVIVYHHGAKGYAGMDYDNLRMGNRDILVDKLAKGIYSSLREKADSLT